METTTNKGIDRRVLAYVDLFKMRFGESLMYVMGGTNYDTSRISEVEEFINNWPFSYKKRRKYLIIELYNTEKALADQIPPDCICYMDRHTYWNEIKFYIDGEE